MDDEAKGFYAYIYAVWPAYSPDLSSIGWIDRNSEQSESCISNKHSETMWLALTTLRSFCYLKM